MNFLKNYWHAWLGVGALVIFFALLVTGVIQP